MSAYPLSPLAHTCTEKHMEAQLRPTQRARTVKDIKKSATFLKGVRLRECAIDAFWQSKPVPASRSVSSKAGCLKIVQNSFRQFTFSPT